MARLRTFIAVELAKPIRDRLISLQERLAQTGADVKWVEAENLHVTLLFLGEVGDREVTDVCRLTAKCVRKHAPFTMTVEGVGCFPNARRPRILWVGVGQGADELCAIHDELEEPFDALGFRREDRRFTPHITLGRVKSDRPADDLSAVLTKHAAWKAGDSPVHEIHMMSSQLASHGPKYTVLSRAPLIAPPD